MESTRDIKGRIKSVTNIQQITKAMKMVAAARLRKAEEKANGSRPYAEKIGELLRRASSVTPGFTSPLFRTGEVKKVHRIDLEKCIKCGACMEKCKFGAIIKK